MKPSKIEQVYEITKADVGNHQDGLALRVKQTEEDGVEPTEFQLEIASGHRPRLLLTPTEARKIAEIVLSYYGGA